MVKAFADLAIRGYAMTDRVAPSAPTPQESVTMTEPEQVWTDFGSSGQSSNYNNKEPSKWQDFSLDKRDPSKWQDFSSHNTEMPPPDTEPPTAHSSSRYFVYNFDLYESPVADQGWTWHGDRWWKWKWSGSYTGDWHTQWIVYNTEHKPEAFTWYSWTEWTTGTY